jgi:hypothetical protein
MTSTAAARTAAPTARGARARTRRGAVALLLTLVLAAMLGAGGASPSSTPVTVAGGPGHCC